MQLRTDQADAVISVSNLSKTYASGFHALKNVNLDIRKGEIFALLGPNGAGKTTLISIVCGIVTPSSGKVGVGGHDIITDYRAAPLRDRTGAAGVAPPKPSRPSGQRPASAADCSARPRNPAHIEKVLRTCRCGTRRTARSCALSGGMKRRVLIAKALAHEPRDPVPRRAHRRRRCRAAQGHVGRWCARLRDSGVTIILTTHYIDEAEEMADRVGVINKGELILVEEKAELMRKLGKKQLTLELQAPLDAIPEALARHNLELADGGKRARLHLRRAGRAHRHHRSAGRPGARPASASATCTPRRARSRTSSSTW